MIKTERQSHAYLHIPSRRLKGMKIERLLELSQSGAPVRLLEVGTGSGGIAHYFGSHKSGRYDVDAVDVCDNRVIKESYRYTHVEGVALPFADALFDVVLTNHVIEHVGDQEAQLTHLREVRRVLKPSGVGYLGVPNRWMLVEPHYHLVFLSWLPRGWRNFYLRVVGKGRFYDCEPLESWRLEGLLSKAGLKFDNMCVEALRATLDIERPSAAVTRVLRKIPNAMLMPLRPLMPTLIYRIWPQNSLND
jgi:SAM-dependent methyltransferase